MLLSSMTILNQTLNIRSECSRRKIFGNPNHKHIIESHRTGWKGQADVKYAVSSINWVTCYLKTYPLIPGPDSHLNFRFPAEVHLLLSCHFAQLISIFDYISRVTTGSYSLVASDKSSDITLITMEIAVSMFIWIIGIIFISFNFLLILALFLLRLGLCDLNGLVATACSFAYVFLGWACWAKFTA